VSLLDRKEWPTPDSVVLMRPPSEPDGAKSLIRNAPRSSQIADCRVYEKEVDRESAYEILRPRQPGPVRRNLRKRTPESRQKPKSASRTPAAPQSNIQHSHLVDMAASIGPQPHPR